MTLDHNPPHSSASTDLSLNNNNFQTNSQHSITVSRISKSVLNNSNLSFDLENLNNPQINNFHRSFKILINLCLIREEFLKHQDLLHVQTQYQTLNFLVHQLLVSNSKEI